MASQDPVTVTKEELDNAETLWKNFGVWSKWGVIFTVAILVILAIVTL